MVGDWFGTLKGGVVEGALRLSLDLRPSGIGGSAALFPADPSLPGGVYDVTLSVRSDTLSGHADLRIVFRRKPFSIPTAQQISEIWPGRVINWSRQMLAGKRQDDSAEIHVTAADGSALVANVKRSPTPIETRVPLEVMSWRDFRQLVLDGAREFGNYVFRGQAQPHALRTAFHRANRFNIVRFSVEDVPRIRNAVAAATDFGVDPSNPEGLAALLGIAQHHGFPTPLMDWTESPFVAAYFAFRDAYKDPKCRPTVFMLNRAPWPTPDSQIRNILDPTPSLGFFAPVPVKNSRLIPQQSILVFCNASDAEETMLAHDGCIRAVQIAGDPTTVMRDLRMMGIGAAAMFPGLDGACRDAFELSIERLEAID